jgi:hypothetical protein
MVLMVQMLSMQPIAEGRGARVSGHDLPTAVGFTRHGSLAADRLSARHGGVH